MARAPFQIVVFPFRQNENGNYEYAIFKRSDDSYWQGIAGGGEDHETPVEAAKREAFEEAKIPTSAKYFRLRAMDMVPVYHFPARKLWPKDIYVIPNYCFGVESSNVDIILSVEHTAFKWVDCETGRALLHWQGNKTALWELNERLGRNDLILV